MPKVLKFIGISVVLIGSIFVWMMVKVANPPHPNAHQRDEIEDLISVVFVDVVGLNRKDLEGNEMGEWDFKSIPDYHAKALIGLHVDESYLHEFVKARPCIREGWCWSALSDHDHPKDQRYTIKVQGTITPDSGVIPYQERPGSIPSMTEIGILPARRSVYFETMSD